MPWRRRVHLGTELDNTEQTLLTFGDNLTEGGAVLKCVTISNRSSSTRRVTLWFVPFSSVASESNTFYEEYVPPNSTEIIEGPWHGDSGSFIKAAADAANSDVGVRLTAAEEFNAG